MKQTNYRTSPDPLKFSAERTFGAGVRAFWLVLTLTLSGLTTIKTYSQGFENVSASNGINFGYSNGEYGGGVSFADFNQDGWDDLTFATGSGSPMRFFQNYEGSFSEVYLLPNNTDEVKQVLWVDFNNDSRLDLYVTAHNGNRLYRNEGDLNFTDITAQCGFFDPPGAQSFCSTWLDFNRDALPDLCVSFRESLLDGEIIFYQNIGNDYFVDVTNQVGLSWLGNSVLAMTTLDYNNDGWTDIYLAQDWNAGGKMIRNNGDETFSVLPQSAGATLYNNSMSATVGDFNGDLFMDIYVTDTYENSLLQNNGDETFTDVAAVQNVIDYFFSWGAVFMDSDNDADIDLHFNTTSGHHAYENPGEGLPFVLRSCDWGFCYTLPYEVGLAAGDMDNDGRMDLATNGSLGNPCQLFRNNFNSYHYLTIKLNASISNAFAIGAVIDVYAGGKHQRRRIACGEGFSSQNSYIQHFGLGAATMADSVTVYWPNGIVTSAYNVQSDQRITMHEVETIPGCTDPMACNYNPLANQSEDDCLYPAQFVDCTGDCLSDVDDDGVCDQLEISGCTDILACNFASAATDEDGTCWYAQAYYTCSSNCINDIDLDGICDELEIAGCLDSLACNYDAEATDSSGECFYLETYDISGNDAAVTGELYAYSYPLVSGSSYEWQVLAPDQIVDGQGTAVANVMWNQAGMRMIRVREITSEGCEGAWVDFTVLVGPSNVNENGVEPILIYPNPADDLLFVELRGFSSVVSCLTLINNAGQVVANYPYPASTMALDVSALSAGLYAVKIKSASAVSVRHFIRK